MGEVAMGDADSVSVTKVGWDSNSKIDKLWKELMLFVEIDEVLANHGFHGLGNFACMYGPSQTPDFKSASIEESSLVNFSSENSKSCTMRPFQFYFIVNIYNLPIIF